jgi:5'-3' exonuclease
MSEEEFEKYKESKTKEAEAIKYLESKFEDKLQRIVKNICTVVTNKYDLEIASNNSQIENCKDRIAQLKKEIEQFDVVLWEENSV